MDCEQGVGRVLDALVTKQAKVNTKTPLEPLDMESPGLTVTPFKAKIYLGYTNGLARCSSWYKKTTK